MEILQGCLLVANGSLMDPNFRRTVVVITEHNDEGTMGLVLNRPADVTVEQAAPALSSLVSGDSPVYVGGPVQPEAAIVVADFGSVTAETKLVVGTIGLLSTLDESPMPSIKRARVFAGYAGWGPGQLEAEMLEDAWILEDALPADVFTDEPERLWSNVLQRKGGNYRMLALMPADPSMN